jgi:hypothetical protein
MIDTPLRVANAKEIAAVPSVDVIFAVSEQMVTTIHDTVLKSGLKLGGPLAWKGDTGGTCGLSPLSSAQ